MLTAEPLAVQPFTAKSFTLNALSGEPAYRQIANQIAARIRNGELLPGNRLPATRELAELLGVNRTTVTSAYAVLEESGYLLGQVGRGSFVAPTANSAQPEAPQSVNFASSRPAAATFPVDAFRRAARTAIESSDIHDILQLGSPLGYGPLRRYLLEEDRRAGLAGPEDDILITNGCQQALDLLARMHARTAPDGSVAVEDPSYHGLLRVFRRTGARLVPFGVDLDGAGSRPANVPGNISMIVVTPDFQNPTGLSMEESARRHLAEAAARTGALLVENAVYSPLRYTGMPLPAIKKLAPSKCRVVLLRSYSKVLFPGLRVGWVLGPRDLIARLAEEKGVVDLHSDQLAQAVFLQIAQGGELQTHIQRTCEQGRERLQALFDSCKRYLPPGTRWTRPEGGMSCWIELPAPLTAEELLRRAARDGVEFLTGSNFAVVEGQHSRGLRLSFGGLTPAEIEWGVSVLGRATEAGVETAAAISV